jgi:2-polyprenyl-3-methyl-5-hydroxy-6-metoxy-1,4-benzoquinol methylase
MSIVTIGIPAYRDVPAETLEDYMRLAYHLGRRHTQHQFFLSIKSKSEQYRARNDIVNVALQVHSDYLFFLDDDHVIDWMNSQPMNDEQAAHGSAYDIVPRLIEHLEADAKRGIVGALYYHRGGNCMPVLMKEGKDGGYYYLRDDQIENTLQEVAVQGGGCMMINMQIFSFIEPPYFRPEADVNLGTDLQICKQAKEHGFSVWSDTSIVVGHVMSRREVVTPRNRHRIIAETGAPADNGSGLDSTYTTDAAYRLYALDASEYLGLNTDEINQLAMTYKMETFPLYEDKTEYYRARGNEQLARQVWFHSHARMIEEMQTILAMVNTQHQHHGLDFGCGSAPVGFELALRGHHMDFVDVDGAGGYAFTKWRAKHRGIEDRCGWQVEGPYDYVLMLDSLEHIEDWRSVLDRVIEALRPDGALITNYFLNTDFANLEHISMDHAAVKKYLVSKGVYPLNQMAWMKRDLGFMDLKEAS